ncbi:MAG: tetratricopeptide repeat protein [Armatimonadota bacterium]|nr:MAG: tetratricopeptide repeat protein [Armatimonadota bacterium]
MGRGAQEDVYLMLVTANVLRLRRQWRLAEAKCSEVLRRDPENASAYSLLGDISRDQGRLRDAIEWYKLALDRDPGSAADRKKLEGVIDRVFSGRGRGVTARAREKMSQGLGRLAADVRGARLPASLVAVIGMALGIIVLIAVSAVLLGRGGVPLREPTTPGASSGAFQVASAEEPSPSVAHVERTGEGAAALERLATEAALLESGLLEHLRGRARALDPNCEVIAVELDAKEGMARVQLLMPEVWGASATRDGIERMALALGAEAASWDGQILAVRVRCDMRGGEGAERMALMAEGSAREVAKGTEMGAATAEEAFAFVWWHPELRR